MVEVRCEVRNGKLDNDVRCGKVKKITPPTS